MTRRVRTVAAAVPLTAAAVEQGRPRTAALARPATARLRPTTARAPTSETPSAPAADDGSSELTHGTDVALVGNPMRALRARRVAHAKVAEPVAARLR